MSYSVSLCRFITAPSSPRVPRGRTARARAIPADSPVVVPGPLREIHSARAESTRSPVHARGASGTRQARNAQCHVLDASPPERKRSRTERRQRAVALARSGRSRDLPHRVIVLRPDPMLLGVRMGIGLTLTQGLGQHDAGVDDVLSLRIVRRRTSSLSVRTGRPAERRYAQRHGAAYVVGT